MTKDGKLGLGISDPEYKLDIVGDLRIMGHIFLANYQDYGAEEKRFTYVDQDGKLKVGGGNELLDYVYRVDCKVLGDNPYPAPVWQSKAGEDFGVLFTATGCPARVGIGTNEPKSILDVRGRTFISDQLDISNLFEFDGGTQPAKLNVYSPSDHGLNIVSAFDGNRSSIRVQRYDNTNKTIFNLHNKGYITLNYFGTNGEMPLAIFKAGTEQSIFRIRPEGGLDLDFSGTSAEVALAIRNSSGDLVNITGDGKIWCQGLHVKYAPFWPDYVFEQDYKLLPLTEVSNYIKSQGHLPGMPVAAEIEQNGVDLYQSTRLLVEKVEELTLYLIQQQEEIEKLRNELQLTLLKSNASNQELETITIGKGGEK